MSMRTAVEQPRFLAVDFYCGAGGTTRGMLDAGGYVIAGIDFDKGCCETYERNNVNELLDREPPQFIARDMFPESAAYPSGEQALVLDELHELIPYYRELAGNVPLMFAICAPCQSFTRFVQRRMTPTRTDSRARDRDLLSQTLRFIDEFQPELVMCENVVSIRRGDSRGVWLGFKEELRIRGYATGDEDVCASKFGVPQYRRRSILIGTRVESSLLSSQLPVPTRAENGTPVSAASAIGSLPPLEAGEHHGDIPNHVCRNLSDLNLIRLQHLKPGEPNFGLSATPWGDLSLACHRRLEEKGRRGFGDVYTRMRPDRPSPTITTRFVSVSNGRFGHFDTAQIRGISLHEGALLQSFPPDYRFYGSGMEHIAKMIGNAVPPKLAESMAQYLVDTWERLPHDERAARG